MPNTKDQALPSISLADLDAVTGGQSLTSINSVPGAWRPNSGMGSPPTPAGNAMSGWGNAAAAGERAAQTGGGGGGGGGKLNPWEKPQLLY